MANNQGLDKYFPDLATILNRQHIAKKDNRLSLKFKKKDKKLSEFIKKTDNKKSIEEEIVKELDRRYGQGIPFDPNGKDEAKDIGRRYCKFREIPLPEEKGYNAIAKFAIDEPSLEEIEQNIHLPGQPLLVNTLKNGVFFTKGPCPTVRLAYSSIWRRSHEGNGNSSRFLMKPAFGFKAT